MIFIDFKFRNATIKDIPFLVDTIIQAEKSGTDKLSYSTIFDLTEDEVKKYLSLMLAEEIDGCELSISSFLVAESNGKNAAACSAWIEGIEGIPSSVLKGNLLNYILPERCIKNAINLNKLIREIHIEYIPNTIQIGSGYVASEYRGHNLLGKLNEKRIEQLLDIRPDISEVWAQIFSCNTPSIRAFEKIGFAVVLVKESLDNKIMNYLPSNRKILYKKDLNLF